MIAFMLGAGIAGFAAVAPFLIFGWYFFQRRVTRVISLALVVLWLALSIGAALITGDHGRLVIPGTVIFAWLVIHEIIGSEL